MTEGGLLGPQGIGGLWIREGLELEPFFSGGTGGDSNLREMSSVLPNRLEAGSGNAPGMAGLSAGIAFLREKGVECLHRREQELKAVLWDGLNGLRGITRRLDQEWEVMVRFGLNCTPEVHTLLGTSRAGAVRFSLGWASTLQDVEVAVRGVDAIPSSPTFSGYP